MTVNVRVPYALAWPLFVAAGAGGCLLAVRNAPAGLATVLAGLLLVLFAAAAVFFTVRLLMFRRRLIACLHRMLQGEYTTGIRRTEWLADDITAITGLINEMVGRVLLYDELRADRVAMHSRALDTVLRTVEMAVMLVDMEAGTLRINASLQRVFGISRETFTLEEIDRQPENDQFMRLFRTSVYRDKTVLDGTARLQLLASRGWRTVEMRVVPIKDRGERVHMALVFLAVQVEPPPAIGEAEGSPRVPASGDDKGHGTDPA